MTSTSWLGPARAVSRGELADVEQPLVLRHRLLRRPSRAFLWPCASPTHSADQGPLSPWPLKGRFVLVARVILCLLECSAALVCHPQEDSSKATNKP